MSRRKGRSAISVIAIVLVAVLIVGGLGFITQGYKNWKPDTWFGGEEEKPPIVSGGVQDGEGNDLEPGKTHAMPNKMMFTANAAEDNPGVDLVAIIQPIDATNMLVDWSVSFVNASSEWASGKNASDYITITPETDGALIANVKCIAAFGEQIQITVASRENNTKKANCVVDYMKRLTGVVVENFVGSGVQEYSETDNGKNVVYYPNGLGDGGDVTLKHNYSFGVGTVSVECTTEMRLILAKSFVDFMSSQGIVLSAIDDSTYIDISANGFCLDREFAIRCFGNETMTTNYSKFARAFSEYFKSGQSDVFMVGVMTMGYNFFEFFCFLTMNANSFVIPVNSVELNNTTLFF